MIYESTLFIICGIIVGIVFLVSVVLHLYKNSFLGVWDFIKEFFQAIWNSISIAIAAAILMLPVWLVIALLSDPIGMISYEKGKYEIRHARCFFDSSFPTGYDEKKADGESVSTYYNNTDKDVIVFDISDKYTKRVTKNGYTSIVGNLEKETDGYILIHPHRYLYTDKKLRVQFEPTPSFISSKDEDVNDVYAIDLVDSLATHHELRISGDKLIEIKHPSFF